MYETQIKPQAEDTELGFYLVEDKRQAGAFVSAIVVATDSAHAKRQVYVLHRKDVGDHSNLDAREIEMTKTEGVVYSVVRR